MDTKKILLLIIFYLVLTSTTFGQEKPIGLQIGDKLPEMLISGVINRSSNSIQLKDLYKDGLLIIDFWATWCSPCISEMKFLDSLKNLHPNRFNVLMVTYEDKALVQNFLSKPINGDIKTSNLVLATDDKVLHKMFPHRVVPHNIWVDKNGIVKAITSQNEITSKNILGFSDSTHLSKLKPKRENLNFDPMEPFHLGDSIFTYRSIITPYIPGIGSGLYGGGVNPRIYFCWNASIADHFWNAYSNCNGSRRASMIEIHVTDSLRILTPVGDDKHLIRGSKYKGIEAWQKENAFSYALTLPKGVNDTILREYMFNDLSRQFNIRPSVERRNILCTIVNKVKSIPFKISQSNGDALPDIKFIDKNKLSIKNANIHDLIDWWFRTNVPKWEPDPFVVEIGTGQNARFDLELDFSTETDKTGSGITPEMFYRQLNKYGLLFKKEIRSYPILVLYDK